MTLDLILFIAVFFIIGGWIGWIVVKDKWNRRDREQ